MISSHGYTADRPDTNHCQWPMGDHEICGEGREQHVSDGDLGLAPDPTPPAALSPQQILRLGAFTVAEEHSEGVEAMLTEQEATYRAIAKRQGVEPLIEALLARDRLLAQHGRTLADGRAAGRLLREAMRAVLYATDAQEVKRLAGMGARRDVESILYALGAEPADAKQLKEHGSTLGPLAPKEDWYGAAVGPDEKPGDRSECMVGHATMDGWCAAHKTVKSHRMDGSLL